MIDFVGFLFSWGDILDTADSIVAYLNAGLQYGEDQILALDKLATGWVDKLRAELKNKAQPPNALANTTTAVSDPSASSQVDDVQHGVGYNWSSYQMKHSGFATNSSTTPPTGTTNLGDDDDPTLSDLWTAITNEVAQVEGLATSVVKDITDLFTGTTDTSQFFARLSDQLIDTGLSTIENVTDFMLKAIVIVLKKVGELGNYVVGVPIFSALWKLIAGGRDFTIFNCIALVFAVPTTVLYKLVANTAPPKLAGRLTNGTFAGYLAGSSMADPTLAKDIATMGSLITVTAGVIALEVNVITFAIDTIVPAAEGKALRAMGKVGGVLPAVGNLIDSVTIILEALGLFVSWPVNYNKDMTLRWWVSRAFHRVTGLSYYWDVES